jgi:alpha-beta hydrolase superfamily lysophospholipase
MDESPVVFGSQSLVGILCEPAQAGEMAVVFVNAGSTHRCGPNRLYTTLARRLAARGYASLRFDISGIGDSPPATDLGKFRDYAAKQVQEAMDYVAQKGYSQLVMLGLCSGADIAFDGGTADERAAGLILVNGAFVDGEAFAGFYHKASRKTANRFYAAGLFSLRRWWRLVTFQSQFWKRLARRKHAAPPAHTACNGSTAQVASVDSRLKWETLARRKANVLLVYSEGSVFWDIYKAANKSYLKSCYPADRLAVAFHKNADHTFTLLSAQERLANQIEQWLDTLPSNHSPATTSQSV